MKIKHPSEKSYHYCQGTHTQQPNEANPHPRKIRANLFLWRTALLVWIFFLLMDGTTWHPCMRLAATTVGLLFLLKIIVFFQTKNLRLSISGFFLFFTIWPGVDPTPFQVRILKKLPPYSTVFYAFSWIIIGLTLSFAIIIAEPHLHVDLVGWLGIVSLLMIVHLGYSEILTQILRLYGWNVGPLFNYPICSYSLTDFWSHRWNIAFVNMNRILFLRNLHRNFGPSATLLIIFSISGILHELALSYPSQAGYGLPLTYFLIHGFLVLFESRIIQFSKWPILFARIWTWFWLITPLPLLFHSAFRNEFIVPLYKNLHHLFYEFTRKLL